MQEIQDIYQLLIFIINSKFENINFEFNKYIQNDLVISFISSNITFMYTINPEFLSDSIKLKVNLVRRDHLILTKSKEFILVLRENIEINQIVEDFESFYQEMISLDKNSNIVTPIQT